MRKTLVILVAIAAVATAARADVVQVGGLAYREVKVTGFSQGSLTFMPLNRPVTKPLADVTLIEMEGKAQFNQAEKLRVKEPQEAVGHYDSAMEAAWVPWQKDLVAWRRLDALSRAGLTGRWAREWTALLAESSSEAAGKLRPGKARDEAELKEAVSHLEAALPNAKGARATVEIKNVLAQLRAETTAGQEQPPADGGPKPIGPDGPVDNGQDKQPEPDIPVAVPADSAGRLGELEEMVKQGKGSQALREIDAFIKQADSRELARAMYLGGVARMQAAKGTDSRLLKEAVLLFMKVAILCPGSSDAPAALFCAGEASELIGDKAGATAAYTDLTVRGGQSEFVKRAAEKLKALQAEGPQDKTEGRPGDKG